ncbi:MAG TPA: sarcosine oxidase subunit gamma family protein [Usitatibacter sp.]|nr:sarcosine oxidase subunit gamma family protein [Usitatibacter sp.]
MPEPILQRSPLARFAPDGAARGDPECRVIAYERAFLGYINLRGRDASFLEAARRVLGVALPLEPNAVIRAGESTVCWLGPDEWLLVVPGAQEARVAADLREALGDTFAAVTQIGSGQTAIVLQGECVRELLAKDCPLDLDAAVFLSGRCAQTRLAKAAVLLRPLEGDAMELIVRRSFADYLWLWLADAGAEYGLRHVPPPHD